MPDKYVTFQLKKDTFAKLMRGVSTLSLPDIAVKGDGKEISIVATDKKTPSSNDYSIVVGETDKKFTAYYKTENFKMIQDDYDVAISAQKISHFINRNKPIQYWVVRDGNGHMVEVFDIGQRHHADNLADEYSHDYGNTFKVSLEYIQGDII